MIQIIAEFKRKEMIIAEYKEQEDIEAVTEEDMTNLFGSAYFDINLFNNVEYFYNWDNWICISDYEQYLVDSHYNPFTGENIVVPSIDFHINPIFDTVIPSDFDDYSLWFWPA